MGSLPEWLAIGALSIGLLITLIRNGRRESKRSGSMETDVRNIKDELADKNHGLNALHQQMSDFKTHCASVSTSLKERVIAIEQEAGKKRRRSG